MKSKLIKPIIVALILTGSFATSRILTPTIMLANVRPVFSLNDEIPERFGDWRVDPSLVPILPSPDVEKKLNQIYDQTLSRTYINSVGQRVMLSISYGGAQTKQLRSHRQEVCYTAQGFDVSNLRHEKIRVANAELPVTKMRATQGSRIEPVIYWFTMGDYAVMSLWDRQKVEFIYSLKDLIPDGFLVRFSSITTDEAEAFTLQTRFAEAMFAALKPEVAARLLGKPAAGAK